MKNYYWFQKIQGGVVIVAHKHTEENPMHGHFIIRRAKTPLKYWRQNWGFHRHNYGFHAVAFGLSFDCHWSRRLQP